MGSEVGDVGKAPSRVGIASTPPLLPPSSGHLGVQLLGLLDVELLTSLEMELQGLVRSFVHAKQSKLAHLLLPYLSDEGFKQAYCLEPRS